jgi:hypothetical protein
MSKKTPSDEYLQNIEYYKRMHKEGFNLTNGKHTNADLAYNGRSTLFFAKLIKDIINKNQINSMLDYGCGKGFFYDNSFEINNKKIKSLRDYWKVEVDLYDPCYKNNSIINENKIYDLVISVDVLEHIPEQDVDWVLERIISKAKKYVFMNVACYPAVALLPNGKNAHININNQDWWAKKIINIKKKFVDTKIICVCALKENGKRILFPLQFDDKITNYSK